MLHGRRTAHRSPFTAWPALIRAFTLCLRWAALKENYAPPGLPVNIPARLIQLVAGRQVDRVGRCFARRRNIIRIYLLSTETLETKPIPISPQCVSEGLPAFSHNGEYLAYWCFRSVAETVLYSLPIAGGQPKMISLFQAVPGGLTWSADDKRLIYALSYGSSDELDEVTVADGSTKQLAFAGSCIAAHSFVQWRQACLQLSFHSTETSGVETCFSRNLRP